MPSVELSTGGRRCLAIIVSRRLTVRVSDEPNDPWPPDVSQRLPDYLRKLRRLADLSQRELSARSGVALATVVRIEAGSGADPRLSTVSRLAAAAGLRLLVCDAVNRPIAPQSDAFDICRDLGDRRLPAHLDVERAPDERYRLWWEPERGAFTFTRDRARRDDRRARNRVWYERYLAERETERERKHEHEHEEHGPEEPG
jgi:transcriptional regulator with XRE-family HTH domain